uniref:MIF4G domain-containing protein n=1 Tax=Cuerna arida TaxID=1464854 RepID=A0A1B6GG58_9HEMI
MNERYKDEPVRWKKSGMDDRYQQRFRLGDEEVYSRKSVKIDIPQQKTKAVSPKMTLQDWQEHIGFLCHKVFFSSHVEGEVNYSESIWSHSRVWGSNKFLGIEKLGVVTDKGLETTAKQIFNERFIMTFKIYFEGLIDFEKRLYDMLKHYKGSEEKKQNWIFQRCQERNKRIVSNSDRIVEHMVDSLSNKYLAQDTVKTCIEYLFHYYDEELMIFLCKLVKKLKTDPMGQIKGTLDLECLDSYCQRLYGLEDNPNVSMKVKTAIQKMQEKFTNNNHAVNYGRRRPVPRLNI